MDEVEKTEGTEEVTTPEVEAEAPAKEEAATEAPATEGEVAAE